MADGIENIIRKLNRFSKRFTVEGRRYIRTAIDKGEELTRKGSIQIEVEKLKWELKQKQSALGNYVAEKKTAANVTDFSHDRKFLELVDEVYKLKLYIEERNKEKLKE